MTHGRRRRWSMLIAGLVVTLITSWALARPGGGHTYGGDSPPPSGGGDMGGGGGDGDDGAGAIFQILIWIAIEHPQIGIPLLIGAVVIYVFVHRREAFGKAWSTRPAVAAPLFEPDPAPARADHQSRARAELERLREADPQLSLVVFEDFLQALFTEVHVARGAGALDRLSPWLGPALRARLAGWGNQPVEAVVVGAMRYLEVGGLGADSERVVVRVAFEANYTEDRTTFWTREHWRLSRSKRARSRAPKKARVFECPSCGAPLDRIVNATCSYCHNVVDTGDFDWVVDEIERVEHRARAPALTGDTPEEGTELPTLIDPHAEQRLGALLAKDPALDWPALEARIRLIFVELGRAWNTQNLGVARPYLSDRQYETLEYWIDAYRRAGLKNLNDDAAVSAIVLARVTADAHFDALTVRVFATSLDYTLDSEARVVGGSRSRPRKYSEYWTLIRGVTVRGTPRAEPVCPSCGAPADVNQAGTCAHCGVEVSSGDFDWVLSRIEQDEAY